jgi:V8-like Glu-specific endopeptidase
MRGLFARGPHRPEDCRVRPGLEILEDRLVLSAIRIADTTQYPYRAIVRIEAHFPNDRSGNDYQGTGALIDANHLLTAAHVIYDASLGGWADQVDLFPAQENVSTFPYGQFTVLRARISSAYQSRDDQHEDYDPHDDYALITLHDPVPSEFGWFSYADGPSADWFSQRTLTTAGYPAEGGYSGFSLYAQAGPLTGTSPDGQLLSWSDRDLTAYGGQSGSPLWDIDPTTNQWTIRGVLVASTDDGTGKGVRLTSSVLADLHRWIDQDNPSPTPPIILPLNSRQGPGSGIGGFDPTTATWYLRSDPAPGGADVGSFVYGLPGWIPVVGDWNGDGVDTVGVVDPGTERWYLRNSNSSGGPDAGSFVFGLPGWIPVVGDWNGDGHTGIGAYDPATATWYLRRGDSSGAADAGVFVFGAPGWVPVTGRWRGGTRSGIGVVDPATANWYLRSSASAGKPDAGVIQFGAPGWQPVTGDWEGTKTSQLGVIDPTNEQWYLRGSTGQLAASFAYGGPGWVGLAGDWKGKNAQTSPVAVRGPAGATALPTGQPFAADVVAALLTDQRERQPSWRG